MVSDEKAKQVIHYVKQNYMHNGGVVTTNFETGQQWDYPNGWAPLQWVTYKACKQYGFDHIAHNLAIKWTNLNVKVFFETGKMLEKYNVVNTHLPGGGGEYKLQDGFGWTNGVFLKLWEQERNKKFLENN
jgi:alpha,alpha-trehalase